MRESFKEFVIGISFMDADDYSSLSDLPQKAKEILITEPPELDPWDLLNQAQYCQDRLIEALRDALGRLNDIKNPDEHTRDIIGKGWDTIGDVSGTKANVTNPNYIR